MDFIVDLFVELLLDRGLEDAAVSKEVPKLWRILVGVILVVCYLGIFALGIMFICIGVRDSLTNLIKAGGIISFLMTVFTVCFAWKLHSVKTTKPATD